MTKLESLVKGHAIWREIEKAPKEEKQVLLDKITEGVMPKLTSQEICDHVTAVYDATAEDYAKNPHTKDVIDELIEFMNMLPESARVYDVGCGPGRDAFFMYVTDQEFRKSLMNRERQGKKTANRYSVPTKNLRVVGLDSSQEMINHAWNWKGNLVNQGLIPKDSWNPFFAKKDMHNFMDNPISAAYVDGVWSCASLFTHTPKELIPVTMRHVSDALAPGGIFFASYTNGLACDNRYNKLLLSSTGHIKYFSQPNPFEIAKVALQYGLKPISLRFTDYEIEGKVLKKNLFVSEFFKKE